jgi:ATP-binding cassette subfamily B protein
MSNQPQSLRQTLPRLDRVLRRFWPQLARQRGLVSGSVAALLIGTLLKLLEPWPLKIVFDRILYGNDYRAAKWTFIPGIEQVTGTGLIAAAAIAVVVITALRAGAEYLNRIWFAIIGNRVLRVVRDQLYRHLQRLSLSFHTSARTGDLTVRVVGDVNMMRDAAVTAVLPLVANSLVLIGIWTVMIVMQWQLALLALATVPLLAWRANHAGSQIRAAARRQRQREGEMASTAVESLAGIRLVQSLCLEPIFAAEFSDRNAKAQKEEVRSTKLSAGLERSVDVILAVATGLVLWYGARLVLAERMTAGDLIVFLTYVRRAFNPVQDFAKYTGRLAKATAAGERVLNLLDREPEIRDRPGAIDAPPFKGSIHFESVSFEYEPDRPVLRDVDLKLSAGETVAIVGPSGGGKTTLVSLVSRLYDPTVGRVTIDGRDVREFTLNSLRQQVSVVLQETLLFASTVRDNIAYANPGATEQQIRDAAQLANATEFIEPLPLGFDTVLGERGVTLSGGQRQRLALARAAVRGGPILLLDEPTAGLDEANTAIVTEALARLARGRTTLYITHDLEQAANADRIIFLDAGQIVETGTHDELLRADGRYAMLYRQQQDVANLSITAPLSMGDGHAVAG